MIKYWLRRLVGHLDPTLMALLGLLLLLSCLSVYSAAGASTAKLSSHLANMGVALAAMLAISLVPPQRLMQFT
ncbi:MAG: rod shape-determining protein RodA, partial [Gallionellaceae bacterium]|nr:rod shape-determining protein RodA [Gallionellaceae bacterium]